MARRFTAASSEYASLPASTIANKLNGASSNLFAVRVKPESLDVSAADKNVILSWSHAANMLGGSINLDATANNGMAKVRFGVNQNTSGSPTYLTSSVEVPIGKWIDIVARCDGSATDQMWLWVNGVLAGPITNAGGASFSKGTPTWLDYVGALTGASPSNFFDGSIAELLIAPGGSYSGSLVESRLLGGARATGIANLANTYLYAPFYGNSSAERDVVNGTSFTLSGTTASGHPAHGVMLPDGVPVSLPMRGCLSRLSIGHIASAVLQSSSQEFSHSGATSIAVSAVGVALRVVPAGASSAVAVAAEASELLAAPSPQDRMASSSSSVAIESQPAVSVFRGGLVVPGINVGVSASASRDTAPAAALSMTVSCVASSSVSRAADAGSAILVSQSTADHLVRNLQVSASSGIQVGPTTFSAVGYTWEASAATALTLAGDGIREVLSGIPVSAQTRLRAGAAASSRQEICVSARTEIEVAGRHGAQAGTSLIFAAAAPDPELIRSLGRKRHGDKLRVALDIGVWPDVPPLAIISHGESEVARLEMPTSGEVGCFARDILLGPEFPLGTYKVEYLAIRSQQQIPTGSHRFDLLSGGDPFGSSISLASSGSAGSLAVLALTEGGVYFQGFDPRV